MKISIGGFDFDYDRPVTITITQVMPDGSHQVVVANVANPRNGDFFWDPAYHGLKGGHFLIEVKQPEPTWEVGFIDGDADVFGYVTVDASLATSSADTTLTLTSADEVAPEPEEITDEELNEILGLPK